MVQTNIKAALLSAFVLPGLGQLYKQHRLKGIFLLLVVNIFLLSAFVFLMKSTSDVMLLTLKSAGQVDAPGILRLLEQKAPAGRWALTCFVVVWVYSVVDALVSSSTRSSDGPKGDN